MLTVEASTEPGEIAVADVIPLTGGLLATLGTELLWLADDGRVVRRRDVGEFQRLVVADDGTSVLIVRWREGWMEVERLVLASGELTDLWNLEMWDLPGSYDGRVLSVFGEIEVADLDLAGEEPQVLWSKRDPRMFVNACVRSQRWMSAILYQPEDGDVVECWTWELPSRRLHARRIESNDERGQYLLTTADGVVLWTDYEGDGRVEWRHGPDGLHRQSVSHQAETEISGEYSALTDGEQITLRSAGAHAPLATVRFPGADGPGFCVHGGVAATWDRGRIVCCDAATGECLLTLRTRA
jgi:hypothetical protein